MIDRLVSFALSQRFIVLMAMIGLSIWGILSFRALPIDAYPDLAPPRVQIVSQWPGHAAEEVERQITIPLEVEMNGIPKIEALRSISLYGLSDVRLTFEDGTDNYFARQQVFERLPDVDDFLGCRDAGARAGLEGDARPGHPGRRGPRPCPARRWCRSAAANR